MKTETSDRSIAGKGLASFVAKILLLSLALFVLLSIDFMSFKLSVTTFDVAAATYLVSLLDTVVVALALTRMQSSRGGLFYAIFAVFYGVTSLLVALESVYLGPLFPVAAAVRVIIDGAIRGVLFSAACVLLLAPLNVRLPVAQSRRLVMSKGEWTWKLIVSGIFWMLLFILFGFAVYIPLAGYLDPVGLAKEQSINLPAWTLPFQAIHGVIWVALTIPMMKMLRVEWKRTALLVAALYGILSVGNLLVPTGMSPGLQAAHSAEILGESFAFGIVAVWLFHLGSRLPT